MDTRSLLKRLALRMLPERILHFVKKVHYAQVLRALSEEDEPDLKVIRHLVAIGHHVADVGANIGVYTSQLMRAKPGKKFFTSTKKPDVPI